MGIIREIIKVITVIKQQKDENLKNYNKRNHEGYKREWIEKSGRGKWEANEEYNKKDGRPGRKDW